MGTLLKWQDSNLSPSRKQVKKSLLGNFKSGNQR